MLRSKVLLFKDACSEKGVRDMEEGLDGVLSRLKVVDVKMTAVSDCIVCTVIYAE